MSRKTRKTLLTAAINEATYGADAIDNGTPKAMLTSGFDLTPIEGDDLERDLDTGEGGHTEMIPVGTHVKASGNIEITGSGTPTTPVAYEPILVGAGYLTTTETGSVEYVRIHDNSEKDVTFYGYKDGAIHIITGARVTFTTNIKVGEIAKQEFEKGITTKFRGMQEETEEVTEFLGIAALTALALMLILLVTQFNSFYQSALVLSAVFMSIVGVLIGLLITGKPFSTTMTGIAIVALSGIVVNNNIVLIDTFNRLKEEFPSLSREDVVIKTCRQRLRPILLTTATTIFGLMPLAMGLSIDVIGREIIVGSRVVGWWGALASSIVFGLAFSTVLTLIFTPAALVIPSRIRAWLQNRYDLFKPTS